ncbi:serine proteinase [Danaus plexippus plexippus]|uniref:Serine proteinase n=1 Tax=Danaus plexippus plexippus TaxID=278856 RepID=A0A212EH14_DANPL|nr:serine proteinase [Danaus plexippus plexippus]
MKAIYLVLAFFVLEVHSMSLVGPVATWYRPCGLGAVFFKNLTSNFWLAKINVSLYNLDKANISIQFEQEVQIVAVPIKSLIKFYKKSNTYTFNSLETIPNEYSIYMKIVNGSGTDIPKVSSIKLNNMVLCNETVKNTVNVKSYNVTKENDNTFKYMCGHRSLKSSEVNQVMGDAKAGDWPWHVAILIRRGTKNLANYQCGGTIISSTAILTAGHCVFINGTRIESEKLVIEAGVVDLRAKDQKGKQTLNVDKVILHPEYSIEHASSDLAILVVNKLRYTEYVQPICIWGPVYDKITLFGRTAMITGFGTTENDVLSNTLRSAYTTIQNDTTCIAFNQNLYSKLLNEFTFCAGLGPEVGVNPRNGDSGGGLTVPVVRADNKVTWFLRGVLSKCGLPTGHKLCSPNFYVVYTDVAPHYGWIYHNAGLYFSSNIIY